LINGEQYTETSYVTSSIENSPWVTDFRYEIELADAVFFLGFSLYDLDIKRILLETTKLKEKCFFIIGHSMDELTEMRISRFGSPVTITVEEFSQRVAKEKETYLPIEVEDFSALSIREQVLPSKRTSFSDRDFINFLLFGSYDENQILESLKSDKKFYLERFQIDNIITTAENGGRVFVVNSDFGNGKTLLLEGLRFRFLEQGYRVFDVSEHSPFTQKELKQISQLNEKVVVLFENYGRWFEEIELFCLNANENAVMVLTERNSSHDVIIETLQDKIGELTIYEETSDTLNDREIEWFLEVFNEYGFWGNYAGASKYQKKQFLTRKCSRQIHAILLSLFDSPNIKEKLIGISNQIKKNSTHFDLLLSIFILTVINHRPTISLLGDIWGPEIINRTNFRRDNIVKQFIDFRNDEVLLKSSIVSEYFIKNVAEASKVVSVLILLAQRVSKLDLSYRYSDLFKNLMRFRNVQSVLPNRGLRQGAIDYYENIKNLPNCKTYPLFWLQYAIACTTTLELIRARTYFETAYSFAKERGWDLFQIDNHFARFLLVEAIESLQIKDAFINFQQAHVINK
jgi:hypothetical protein